MMVVRIHPNFALFFILSTVLLPTSCKVLTLQNRIDRQLKKDPLVSKIISDATYEAQILYTHVDLRDTTFVSDRISLNDQYFYPASMVKMPIALMALHYINQQNKLGLDIRRTDALLQYATRPEQSDALIDTTTNDRRPTIERYIEKVFAVSDNDAYNRLYEFLGPDYINKTGQSLGIFKDTRICHRVGVAGYTPEDNKFTTRYEIMREGTLIDPRSVTEASKTWTHDRPNSIKGKGYWNSKDSLVNEPFDFSRKNYYSVTDMEGTLKRVMFPNKFPKEQRYDFTSDDYAFVRRCLSDMPATYPFYRQNPEYFDTYVKFLYYGSEKDAVINPDLTIYNKVGNAYGYLIDCAYFENKKLGIGFFLTAVIHVNADEIYNDGKYEYDEVGYPYLKRLGQIIYDEEVRFIRNK